MTTAINNYIYDIGVRRTVPYNVAVDGSFDINQGDMVWIDTATHIIKPVVDDASAGKMVGVAADTSWRNLYGTKKYTDNGRIEVLTAGIFQFNTTSGDTYNDGDTLWIGADAQTVTNTVGSLTKKIGTVKLRPGQAATAGGAGITIEAVLIPQLPTNAAI